MKAMTTFLPCIWNPAKVWIITRTTQGKYYTNNSCSGTVIDDGEFVHDSAAYQKQIKLLLDAVGLLSTYSENGYVELSVLFYVKR